MRKESCAKMNSNSSRGRRWLREMPETDFEWRWSGEKRYQLEGSFLGAWLEELFFLRFCDAVAVDTEKTSYPK